MMSGGQLCEQCERSSGARVISITARTAIHLLLGSVECPWRTQVALNVVLQSAVGTTSPRTGGRYAVDLEQRFGRMDL
jgi:hypothetical protein